MRAAVISCLCVFLCLLGMPSPCSPDTTGDLPPFLVVGGKANVLIILDNSNSMDEDFNGGAVGSFSASSKSIAARKALQTVINRYRSKLRIGLMAYKLPSVNSYYLSNSQYFASYDLQSYCPNAPDACADWCASGNTTKRTICSTNCTAKNSQFNVDYFDEIISYYSTLNSEQRTRYCSLVYPKENRYVNPTDTSNYIYTKQAYPYYSSGDPGNIFCYGLTSASGGNGPYYPQEGQVSGRWDGYRCYTTKTGTSDAASGYGGSNYATTFSPTDTDYALGFQDFGRRLPSTSVGLTWYANTSPGGGFLYVDVSDISSSTSTVYTKLMQKLKIFASGNSTTGYTSCSTQSSTDSCAVINAGLTPTPGTLRDARVYFNATSTSPISKNKSCEKNYIVLVTDGLPSVAENGTARTAAALMNRTLQRIDNLRQVKVGTCSTIHDVKTYVLGVGLPNDTNVNNMAIHGGTDDNGKAYYASSGDELADNLDVIFSQIGRDVGSAGAVATVSQEVTTGDIVVRGAFKAYDLDNPSRYIWNGHLESYWPYEGCAGLAESVCKNTSGCTYKASNSTCSGSLYSFQLSANSAANLFCSDAYFTGGHCLDGGYGLAQYQAGSRHIFTWLSSARVGVNATGTGNSTVINSALNTALNNKVDFTGDGVLNIADTGKLIEWLGGSEGSHALGGAGNYTRDRDGWLLGDIVYSTPVVVGPPAVGSVPRTLRILGCESTCYLPTSCLTCYNSQNATLHRDQMVYTGANDGMLHAYNLGKWNGTGHHYDFSDAAPNSAPTYTLLGRERWAYVPSNLLSVLQNLAKPAYGVSTNLQHRYMVDLSPQTWEVRWSSSGTPYWRTTLLGGERDGGDTYFALDVTDPGSPNVLYEYSALKNHPGNVNSTTLWGCNTIMTTYYDALKLLPLTRSLPCMGRFGPNSSTQYAAISGGGIREFNPGVTKLDNSTTIFTQKLKDIPGWYYLYYPTFRAVNLSGTDLWKSTWASLLTDSGYRSEFYVNQSLAGNNTPWAVSNVAVFDIYGSSGYSVTNHGTADAISDVVYAGDLNGTFYTIPLQGYTNATNAYKPRCMVTRKVKNITDARKNIYRGKRQPITVTPVGALDTDGNLRVYFGTGKFDNVIGGNSTTAPDDKNDNATMALYCMVEDLSSRISCDSSTCEKTVVANSTTNIGVYRKCRATDYNGTNTRWWTKKKLVAGINMTVSDGDSCFPCIFDFQTPGERMTDSALVAGGYVFFTTFVPSTDRCTAGGQGYLYVLDYMCNYLSDPYVIGNSTAGIVQQLNKMTNLTGVGTGVGALKLSLGSGMPSRPVLDSSGTSILIQTSDQRLIRIDVKLTPSSQSLMRGWSTGPYKSDSSKP